MFVRVSTLLLVLGLVQGGLGRSLTENPQQLYRRNMDVTNNPSEEALFAQNSEDLAGLLPEATTAPNPAQSMPMGLADLMEPFSSTATDQQQLAPDCAPTATVTVTETVTVTQPCDSIPTADLSEPCDDTPGLDPGMVGKCVDPTPIAPLLPTDPVYSSPPPAASDVSADLGPAPLAEEDCDEEPTSSLTEEDCDDEIPAPTSDLTPAVDPAPVDDLLPTTPVDNLQVEPTVDPPCEDTQNLDGAPAATTIGKCVDPTPIAPLLPTDPVYSSPPPAASDVSADLGPAPLAEEDCDEEPTSSLTEEDCDDEIPAPTSDLTPAVDPAPVDDLLPTTPVDNLQVEPTVDPPCEDTQNLDGAPAATTIGKCVDPTPIAPLLPTDPVYSSPPPAASDVSADLGPAPLAEEDCDEEPTSSLTEEDCDDEIPAPTSDLTPAVDPAPVDDLLPTTPVENLQVEPTVDPPCEDTQNLDGAPAATTIGKCVDPTPIAPLLPTDPVYSSPPPAASDMSADLGPAPLAEEDCDDEIPAPTSDLTPAVDPAPAADLLPTTPVENLQVEPTVDPPCEDTQNLDGAPAATTIGKCVDPTPIAPLLPTDPVYSSPPPAASDVSADLGPAPLAEEDCDEEPTSSLTEEDCDDEIPAPTSDLTPAADPAPAADLLPTTPVDNLQVEPTVDPPCEDTQNLDGAPAATTISKCVDPTSTASLQPAASDVSTETPAALAPANEPCEESPAPVTTSTEAELAPKDEPCEENPAPVTTEPASALAPAASDVTATTPTTIGKCVDPTTSAGLTTQTSSAVAEANLLATEAITATDPAATSPSSVAVEVNLLDTTGDASEDMANLLASATSSAEPAAMPSPSYLRRRSWKRPFTM